MPTDEQDTVARGTIPVRPNFVENCLSKDGLLTNALFF